MIHDVVLTPLRKISDERGRIMHLYRRDWPIFRGFGEAYFSVVNPGVVKAWHLHKEVTLNYTAVTGMISTVLFVMKHSSASARSFGLSMVSLAAIRAFLAR